jgi:2-dehydropantoate 2-reductase
MRVCVVGCGAVGSLFAAALAQLDDVEVWAYDLDPAHVAAINEHGLRISGAGELVGRVRATTDAAELPPCDFGIVAVKSMHTDSAMAATAHAFASGAVCSVQNGAGNEEIVAEHVREVIRGTTFPAGHVIGPGHVGWDTKGDTHIGPFEPSPAPMARAVMAEGRAVADAQGIALDMSPEELFDFAARKEVAYDHKPSMLQDVEAGRQTEVDFLNGAIATFGDRYGVDAPLNRALTALVKGLERSRQ